MSERRVFHHYSECEEFRPDGMWRIVTGPATDGFIQASADLMRDCAAFLAAMVRAIEEWPKSCEMNLTAISMNHRAWFGHAGCFLATGSPEACTRLGWHTLDQSEQDAANATADLAIAEWHRRRPRLPGQLSLLDHA
jgi:hypothetical protein